MLLSVSDRQGSGYATPKHGTPAFKKTAKARQTLSPSLHPCSLKKAINLESLPTDLLCPPPFKALLWRGLPRAQRKEWHTGHWEGSDTQALLNGPHLLASDHTLLSSNHTSARHENTQISLFLWVFTSEASHNTYNLD